MSSGFASLSSVAAGLGNVSDKSDAGFSVGMIRLSGVFGIPRLDTRGMKTNLHHSGLKGLLISLPFITIVDEPPPSWAMP